MCVTGLVQGTEIPAKLQQRRGCRQEWIWVIETAWQSEGLVNLFYRGPEKWRFKSKHANIATSPLQLTLFT